MGHIESDFPSVLLKYRPLQHFGGFASGALNGNGAHLLQLILRGDAHSESAVCKISPLGEMDVRVIVIDKVLDHVVIVSRVVHVDFLEAHNLHAVFFYDLRHLFNVRMGLGIHIPGGHTHGHRLLARAVRLLLTAGFRRCLLRSSCALPRVLAAIQ